MTSLEYLHASPIWLNYEKVYSQDLTTGWTCSGLNSGYVVLTCVRVVYSGSKATSGSKCILAWFDMYGFVFVHHYMLVQFGWIMKKCIIKTSPAEQVVGLIRYLVLSCVRVVYFGSKATSGSKCILAWFDMYGFVLVACDLELNLPAVPSAYWHVLICTVVLCT